MARIKLFIPGPVENDEAVLAEMSRPLVPHYGPEWVQVYNQTIQDLKQLFQTREDLFLIVGSGSAGLDAGIGSLLEPGEEVLIGVNGWFGRRLVEIAQCYRAKVISLKIPWGKAITADDVEKALNRNPDVRVVIMVHCETSTGVLNPIADIGKITSTRGLILMVDGITSIGGEKFMTDAWGVDVAVTASQKCMAAPPGLTAVAVSKRAWQKMENRKSKPCGWYLNLLTWRDYARRWADWHPHPVTIAVNNVFALKKALQNILAEGLENCFRRHRQTAAFVRNGIRELGLELVADEAYAASTVTAVKAQPQFISEELIDFLQQNYSLRIANGIDETSGKWFRIGHMGKEARPQSLAPVLSAIKDFLIQKERIQHDC